MSNIENKIARSFSKRAKNYSDRADIQSHIAENLCYILTEKYYSGNDIKIADIGCGTGFIAQNMAGTANVLQLDIAKDMCEIASKYGDTLQADMNDMPLKNGSFDVVISSMAFQWSTDLLKTFSECSRILNEGGILLFSIPSNNSLKNLRNTLKQIDKNDIINDFFDSDYIMDLLEFSGLNVIDFQKEDIEIEFDDTISILKSFKEIGANIKLKNNSKLNKNDLKFLEDNYPQDQSKKLLEWEIFYITAKK